MDPPAPVLETPPSQEEITKRIEEAEQLGQLERSPKSSPIWYLAQMAVEAGPSTLGGEEPACKKFQPTVGGKAPRRNSCSCTAEEAPKVLTGDSCSSWDLPVPKEHGGPYSENALLMASLQDSPRSGQIWLVLPGMHHFVSAGSCRGIFGWASGRCQLLCHTC